MSNVNEHVRTARLALTGDLDLYRRDEVAAKLPPPGSVDRVLIDCRGVVTMDSSILTLLMRYRRSFEDAGGNPLEIVVIVTPPVRRLFEVAGVTKVITVVTAPPLDHVTDAESNAGENKAEPA